MKKVTFLVAIAALSGLASCTAQSPKANITDRTDSVVYNLGVAYSQGLKENLAYMGIDSTNIEDFIRGVKDAVLNDSKKDIAYYTGIAVASANFNRQLTGLEQQIFDGDSTKTINKKNFIAGFIDGYNEKKDIFSPEEAGAYVDKTMQEIQTENLEKKFGDNKAAGEKFLAENKKKEGVVTLPSGVQYKVITEGKGEKPAATSKVKVNYKGTLIDGTEFDSSYSRNEPATFRVNGVIPGWTEALQLMPVGSKWEIYIPQEQAYGAHPQGGVIKPFSALIFEVELVSIEDEENKK